MRNKRFEEPILTANAKLVDHVLSEESHEILRGLVRRMALSDLSIWYQFIQSTMLPVINNFHTYSGWTSGERAWGRGDFGNHAYIMVIDTSLPVQFPRPTHSLQIPTKRSHYVFLMSRLPDYTRYPDPNDLWFPPHPRSFGTILGLDKWSNGAGGQLNLGPELSPLVHLFVMPNLSWRPTRVQLAPPGYYVSSF